MYNHLCSHFNYLSFALYYCSKLKDNKKSSVDRYKLMTYFYKQILNDIITGISLEKKANELINSNERETYE